MKTFLKLALLATSVSMASLASAQAEMKPIGDNVYHYFEDWYGSLVVVGDKGVLVVDPSWTERGNKLKAEVAKLTDKPITHVVVSHEHYDHAGGTEVFDGAKVVAQSSAQKFFDLDPYGNAPKAVNVAFDEAHSIDLGGKVVELKHIASGDGAATTVIYVPQDQVVATADLYVPGGLTGKEWMDDKNYLGTRKILNEIASWPLKHSIASHSDNTDPQALKDNAAFMNDLYQAVKAEMDKAVAKGGPDAAFELLQKTDFTKTLKLPKYKDWDGYKDNLPSHVWRMGMSIMHGG